MCIAISDCVVVIEERTAFVVIFFLTPYSYPLHAEKYPRMAAALFHFCFSLHDIIT